MKLIGKVVEEPFGKGSKSEQQNAIFLDTGEKKYRLHLLEDNPFENKSLQKFIGKTIEAEGYISDYFFKIANKNSFIILK